MRGKFKSLTMVNWNGFFARTFDLDQLVTVGDGEGEELGRARAACGQEGEGGVVAGGHLGSFSRLRAS